MLKISRESEINLINVLIDHDIISGKDLPNIKKVSTEKNSSQIDAVFELKLTDENKILDVLVKEQNLDVIDLTKCELTDEIKAVLPSNYIKMNFVAPFKVEGKNWKHMFPNLYISFHFFDPYFKYSFFTTCPKKFSMNFYTYCQIFRLKIMGRIYGNLIFLYFL